VPARIATQADETLAGVCGTYASFRLLDAWQPLTLDAADYAEGDAIAQAALAS
jgi:hypothetical protein